MSLLDALNLVEAGRLDEAHKIVQDDDSADGALLHGLIHRREGDIGNAAYWFRRAGRDTPPEDAIIFAELRGKHHA